MNAHNPAPFAELLACVPPPMVRGLWPVVFPFLDRAYERMDMITPPDLADWLARRDGLLWVILSNNEIVGALTTSLVPRRSGLYCRIAAGGAEDFASCRHFHTQIEEYARREGCVMVYVEGRLGWQRALRDEGYHAVEVSLAKRIA